MTRVADALAAVGAISGATAEAIVDEFVLAWAVRLPAAYDESAESAIWPRSKMQDDLMRMLEPPPLPAFGLPRTLPPKPDRVVGIGQVIPVHAGDVTGKLHLLALVQTARGARITIAARNRGSCDPLAPVLRPPAAAPLIATDNTGTIYTLDFWGHAEEQWTGELWLKPAPRHEVRWLDLTPVPGLPATRIDLHPLAQPPEVTVTATPSSPGEHLLNGVALRILAWAVEFLPGLRYEIDYPQGYGWLGGVADGLGDVIGALHAVGSLPPHSPVPGRLAALYAGLELGGHGIAARPAFELPEPWRSVLEHCRRGRPDPEPAPRRWSCADAAVLLPELDGARVAILGLRTSEHGTIMNIYPGGVDHRQCYVERSPLPQLWLLDSLGQWHATRDENMGSLFGLRLVVAPPISPAADCMQVIAIGRAAEVRATLPLHWKDY